jgi:hypothetical protein
MNLPGSIRILKNSKESCENHYARIAEFRIQGETDSFGAEYEFLCRECFEKREIHSITGNCDWCGSLRSLSFYRDLEEGFCGPVYRVCSECMQKDKEKWIDG